MLVPRCAHNDGCQATAGIFGVLPTPSVVQGEITSSVVGVA
jgi:hypothetical protein